MNAPKPFTPETLADRWGCSPKHVRNLVNRGELRGFKLGGKLVRIPADAVEEAEQCKTTPLTKSDGSEAASPSPSTSPESEGVTNLTPELRATLDAKRRRSTPR